MPLPKLSLGLPPMKFPLEVVEKLGFYVYIDPTNEEIFYIGKGKGNRAFVHLQDEHYSEKWQRIHQIKDKGHSVRIELLRYGLTEREALLEEAATIDLLGFGRLTNNLSGHH